MRSNQSKRNGSSSLSTVPLADDNLAVGCASQGPGTLPQCVHKASSRICPEAGRSGWPCPVRLCPRGRQSRMAVPSSGRTGWHYLWSWQYPGFWPCCGVQIFVIPVMRCQSCLVGNSPEQPDHLGLYPPWCLWESCRKDLGCISISC